VKACENEDAESQPRARLISSLIWLLSRKALATRLTRQRVARLQQALKRRTRKPLTSPLGRQDSNFVAISRTLTIFPAGENAASPPPEDMFKHVQDLTLWMDSLRERHKQFA